MTNIWSATRDYNRKLSVRRDNRAKMPALFAETPEQRRAAMIRLREQYPTVFVDSRETREIPLEKLGDVVERYRRDAPAQLSVEALRRVNVHVPAGGTGPANQT
jgi:hypothetical protein